MNIIEKTSENGVLKLVVDSNEESLFSVLKAHLENHSDVDIVGIHKEHHLLDKTEFYLKMAGKKDPVEFLKKELPKIKKEVDSMKVK